jgi:hypothetical protein
MIIETFAFEVIYVTKKPVGFSYTIHEVTNLIGLYVKMVIIYSILSIWWKISIIKDDLCMHRFIVFNM